MILELLPSHCLAVTHNHIQLLLMLVITSENSFRINLRTIVWWLCPNTTLNFGTLKKVPLANTIKNLYLPKAASPGIIFFMKTNKPRNPVARALHQRGGSGPHQKTHKQLRSQWKRRLED